MAGISMPTMEELLARFRHWVADCPLDIAFNEGADEAEIIRIRQLLGSIPLT